MKAYEYLDWLEKQRQEMLKIYEIEPLYKTLFRTNIYGDVEKISCFIHPNDKYVGDIESLKHTYREL